MSFILATPGASPLFLVNRTFQGLIALIITTLSNIGEALLVTLKVDVDNPVETGIGLAKGGVFFMLILFLGALVYGYVANPIGFLDSRGKEVLTISFFVFGMIVYIIYTMGLKLLPTNLRKEIS